MTLATILARTVCSLTLALSTLPAIAADFPAPREGIWAARDFRFQTGEVMPELRLHYTTVGEPTGEPVVILHGTTGSGAALLSPGFGGELFGAGQPLDASRYFIILPDAIGTGKSSKSMPWTKSPSGSVIVATLPQPSSERNTIDVGAGIVKR